MARKAYNPATSRTEVIGRQTQQLRGNIAMQKILTGTTGRRTLSGTPVVNQPKRTYMTRAAAEKRYPTTRRSATKIWR